MSKYAGLGPFLKAQCTETVAMTFREIEKVTGTKLPNSRRYPAWWSNNAWNNVMTKVWLDAGFRTEQVDIAGERLVFRRAQQQVQERPRVFEPAKPGKSGGHPVVGALKGTFTIETDWDLSKAAFDAADMADSEAATERTAILIEKGLRGADV
jgi:hypothetical protein